MATAQKVTAEDKNLVKNKLLDMVSTPAAAATEAKPLRLVLLKKDITFKGARQAWWERIKGMEGKTKDEVMASLEKDRPSVYGSKSKHAGNPEPVPG